MKRVIIASSDALINKCESFIAKISRLLDYAELNASAQFRKSLDATNDAFRQLHDFGKICFPHLTAEDSDYYLDKYDELHERIQRSYENLRKIQDERKQRRGRDFKSSLWSTLTGSEQYAVELAKQRIHYYDEDIKTAAYLACETVSEGNAEPEYEDEEFYLDEPNEKKVIEYLESLEESSI